MNNSTDWLNWKPAESDSEIDSKSPTKPSKPSKPDDLGTPVPNSTGHNGLDADWPPEFDHPSIQEIAAYARIGSAAPEVAATDDPLPARFDGFVAKSKSNNIVEGRLDSSGILVIRPVTGSYPEPAGFRTVVAGYGADQVRYTAARHRIDGTNRLGQSSLEFPYVLFNLAARKRCPCDLRLAEWYRSEQAALDKYAPPESPEPEPTACVATFVDGVEIELRREGASRWEMWERRPGYRARRRSDFSGAFLDHAKRTATHWYGDPVTAWQAKAQGRPVTDLGQEAGTLDLWAEEPNE